MKHIFLFVFISLFYSVFSQPIKLVSKTNLEDLQSVNSTIILPNKGILSFANIQNRVFLYTFYDFDLNKKSSSFIKGKFTKGASFLKAISSDDGIHVYYVKQDYSGLSIKTKVDEILINPMNEVKLFKYNLDNNVKILDINRIDGNNVFSGFEMYRPWNIRRVAKFTFGFLIYPLAVPTRPDVRPFLATLKEGNLTYINRTEFESSKYKGLGIHDVKIDKEVVYLGLTSGVVRSKSPIAIVKTNTSFSEMKHTIYSSKKLERINTFQFCSLKNDTIGFDATTGKRLFYDFMGGNPVNYLDFKKTMARNFLLGDCKRDSISVEKDKGKFIENHTNEVFQSKVYSQNSSLRKWVNNEDIEVVISENMTPIYSSSTSFSRGMDGQTTVQSVSTLLGYSFTNLQVNIRNHTKGISKVFSVDTVYDMNDYEDIREVSKNPLKFYNFVYGAGEVNTEKHSTITFGNDSQFYVSYLNGLSRSLTIVSVSFEGLGEEQIVSLGEPLIDSKTDKEVVAYFESKVVESSIFSIRPISDKEFLLIEKSSIGFFQGLMGSIFSSYKNFNIYKML